ncbi:MAG TPA: hypothetical protein VL995_20585 [Cellvibrio sp.]|nr:hypothetical protein [Cellvibrio sp.]
MNKWYLLPSGLLLSTTLMLSGCGGGGGGGNSTTPASNAPQSASNTSSLLNSSFASNTSLAPTSLSTNSLSSSSVASSSVPTFSRITVKGLVVADAMAGGEVVFQVGSKNYSVPVNDQLQYEVTLDVENATVNQPFSAIATGKAGSQNIQFASLFPSLKKIFEIVGNDGVLEAAEFIGVNISPMTTAEYSMVLDKSVSLETDEQRRHALLKIDAQDQFERAVFLTAVLDADVLMPSNYDTTLAMLLDYEFTRARINIMHRQYFRFRDEITSLQDDSRQVNVSKKPMIGKYLVRSEDIVYLLDFNADGTGHLQTSNNPYPHYWSADGKNRQGSFKWSRTGSEIQITLDAPLEYGKSFRYNGSVYPQCEAYTPERVPDCIITLETLTISLINENDIHQFADIAVGISMINRSNFRINSFAETKHKVALIGEDQFLTLSAATLGNHEWYTNGYRYVFNENGTAIQQNQLTKAESTVNWQINNGVLEINGNALLVPLYAEANGFSAIQLLNLQISNNVTVDAFGETLFIKREPVNMATTDWVGRWHRMNDDISTATFDYFSNHVYRDGFETQALGSWAAVNGSHVSGISNGYWQMEHELLAIHNGKHYMQYCYGEKADNFVPTDCIIDTYAIDKTFSGTTFWENWSNPLFQSETEVWRFYGNIKLYRDNGGDINIAKISPNRLYNINDGTIYEMLSSDSDSIDVCEYYFEKTCEEGTTHKLQRGLELKFTINGQGKVNGVSNSNSLMFPRQKESFVTMIPAPGYELKAGAASGCDGSLQHDLYAIPPRSTECEITVNFTVIP